MIKMRHDNDVTDHTATIYTKNDFELSWPNKLDAIYAQTILSYQGRLN